MGVKLNLRIIVVIIYIYMIYHTYFVSFAEMAQQCMITASTKSLAFLWRLLCYVMLVYNRAKQNSATKKVGLFALLSALIGACRCHLLVMKTDLPCVALRQDRFFIVEYWSPQQTVSSS